MFDQLMILGQLSIGAVRAVVNDGGTARSSKALAGYPVLRAALDRAERSGVLAAERRKLAAPRLTC